MGFSLVFRGNPLPLRSEAIIGRAPACAVRLDGPGVSRRHARLVVDDEGVTVQDLESANGVLVNGDRLDGRRRLAEGDWLTIGGHSLQLVVDDRPVAADDIDDEESDHGVGLVTERASQLTLTGAAALEMIELGLVREAERLLARLLEPVLIEARETGKLESSKRQEAARFALELALATGEGRWIGYVLSLFETTRTMMTPELMAILRTAASRTSGSVDLAPLAAYVTMLRERQVGAAAQDVATAERWLDELRSGRG